MNRAFSQAERHLRLVFHRFMDERAKPISIWLNGRCLQAIDPFARKHPAHQEDPEDRLQLIGGIVSFQCFTLPHHKARSEEHTYELQSLMCISHAVFRLKTKNYTTYI